MVNTNKIVGQNVKKYIEGKGIKHSWVMERTGIKKTAYYNFLKGEGNVEEYVAKINKLFRINDPFFFYKADMELNGKTFSRSRSDSFMNYVAPRVLIIQNYTYAFHKFGHTQTKQRPSRISNREEAAQRKNGERTK